MENTNTSSQVASSFTIDEWQNDCVLSLLPCTHQELKNRFILNLYLCFCNKNNSPLAHLQKCTLFAPLLSPPPPLPAPKKMHNLCILFPMGISAIPRETEDTNYKIAKCFSFLGGGGGGK